MNRARPPIAFAACCVLAATPAEAHGNLGLPSWIVPAVLAYYFWYVSLFVAAIWAAIDREAAVWLRVFVPLSMVIALTISFHTARNHQSFHDQFVEAYAALLLPTFFVGLWLVGVILRKRDGY
jgi:hypothetical protein